jgi:hypothetical protein
VHVFLTGWVSRLYTHRLERRSACVQAVGPVEMFHKDETVTKAISSSSSSSSSRMFFTSNSLHGDSLTALAAAHADGHFTTHCGHVLVTGKCTMETRHLFCQIKRHVPTRATQRYPAHRSTTPSHKRVALPFGHEHSRTEETRTFPGGSRPHEIRQT